VKTKSQGKTFQLALRKAYADKQGLIVACNRAYRAAAADGNTKLTETFRRALWQLLRSAGYINQVIREITA
jgi:hypothetical protein